MDIKQFLRCFNSCPFHKSCHKCFPKSGPLLQIRSHIAVRNIAESYRVTNREDSWVVIQILNTCSFKGILSDLLLHYAINFF